VGYAPILNDSQKCGTGRKKMTIDFSINGDLIKKLLDVIKEIFVPQNKGDGGINVTINGSNNNVTISPINSVAEINKIDATVNKSIPMSIKSADGSELLTLWLNCSTAGGDKQHHERFAFGAYLSCQCEGKTIPIWLGAIANNCIREMEIGIEFSKKSWESVSDLAAPKILLGAKLTNAVYWWPINGFSENPKNDLLSFIGETLSGIYQESNRKANEAMKAVERTFNSGDESGCQAAVEKLDDFPQKSKL
jgi:hypothetical protein